MAGWKTDWRSFYYVGAPAAEDPALAKGRVALLVIDVQNTYLVKADPAGLPPAEQARIAGWAPFHERMHGTVIPTIARLVERFRADGNPVVFARIACLTADGADRSLSQKKPGWNNLFLPKDAEASQIVPELAPVARRSRGDQDDRFRADRHQSAAGAAQHGHHPCGLHRHLHRPVRVVDRTLAGR